MVYAVWLPMLATDSRRRWSASNLPGASVSQYWDGDRAVGTWLADHDVGGLGFAGVVWDAFFLFGPNAHWIGEPAPLLASGSPVVSETGSLERALRRLGPGALRVQ
jgi:hypothetical protein